MYLMKVGCASVDGSSSLSKTKLEEKSQTDPINTDDAMDVNSVDKNDDELTDSVPTEQNTETDINGVNGLGCLETKSTSQETRNNSVPGNIFQGLLYSLLIKDEKAVTPRSPLAMMHSTTFSSSKHDLIGESSSKTAPFSKQTDSKALPNTPNLLNGLSKKKTCCSPWYRRQSREGYSSPGGRKMFGNGSPPCNHLRGSPIPNDGTHQNSTQFERNNNSTTPTKEYDASVNSKTNDLFIVPNRKELNDSEQPLDLTGCNGLEYSLLGIGDVTKDVTLYVQLAKKTAYPIQAKVTEWLKKSADIIAVSAAKLHYLRLSPEDKQELLNSNLNDIIPYAWVSVMESSWHRMLALFMAEHAIKLVVVEDRLALAPNNSERESPSDLGFSLPWSLLREVRAHGFVAASHPLRRPDSEFAKSFQKFLQLMEMVNLSSEVFNLLRQVLIVTGENPEALPSAGVHVIEEYLTKIKPSPPPSLVTELPVNLDYSVLSCALKLLSTFCSYKVANLLCSHLKSDALLDEKFVLGIHQKFLDTLSILLKLNPSFTVSGDPLLPIHLLWSI